jgi:hypothetical protein
MKKFLLFLSMMCAFAVCANAGSSETNFYYYRYANLHQKYYTQTNCFYAAPLVYCITSDGEVAVAGADMNETSIEIPSSVTYQGKTYAVTSIHGYAFQRCSKLATLTIPASVNYIYTSTYMNKTIFATGPFEGCKNLKTINDNAMKAQGFWNKDAQGKNLFQDVPADAVINTPEGSDYTSWAKYVNGLGLSVKITASGLGSYFINKDLTVPTTGVSAIYLVTGSDDDAAFTELRDGFIPANTAFIAKVNANSNVTFRTTTIPTEVKVNVADNLLKGSMEDQTAESSHQFYILSKTAALTVTEPATFEAVATGTTLTRNQAYLPNIKALQTTANGTTTGIKAVRNAEQNTIYYDLQGRRVNNPAQGVYIQNHKKNYIHK